MPVWEAPSLHSFVTINLQKASGLAEACCMNFVKLYSPVRIPPAIMKQIAGLAFPICGHQPPRKQMESGKAGDAGDCMPPRRHLLACADDGCLSSAVVPCSSLVLT